MVIWQKENSSQIESILNTKEILYLESVLFENGVQQRHDLVLDASGRVRTFSTSRSHFLDHAIHGSSFPEGIFSRLSYCAAEKGQSQNIHNFTGHHFDCFRSSLADGRQLNDASVKDLLVFIQLFQIQYSVCCSGTHCLTQYAPTTELRLLETT